MRILVEGNERWAFRAYIIMIEHHVANLLFATDRLQVLFTRLKVWRPGHRHVYGYDVQRLFPERDTIW
jgi:hypothetical protein